MVCLLEELQEQFFEQKTHSRSVENRRNIPLSSTTTVEAHSCLLNMHVTFDLAEMMPQQDRKQLEAELEKSCCSLGVCIQLL